MKILIKILLYNGGYEEYIGENKSMPYHALNLLMPDFSGTIARELCFPKQHYESIVASKPDINS